jgi:hypothetical protein
MLENNDIRWLYMGACFFLFSTSASLGIYATTQLASNIVPIMLVSEIHTLAIITAAASFGTTVVSFCSVIMMWLRKFGPWRMTLAILCFLAFAMLIIFIWCAATMNGTYDQALRQSFYNSTQVTFLPFGGNATACGYVQDSIVACCGWDTHCNPGCCPGVRACDPLTSCKELADVELRDFFLRVLPTVAFLVFFTTGAVVFRARGQRHFWGLPEATPVPTSS